MNRRQYQYRKRLRRELATAKRERARAAHYREVAEHMAVAAGATIPERTPQEGQPTQRGMISESDGVESLAYTDYFSPLLDQISDFRQYPEFGGIWNVNTDWAHGGYWPFFRTEPELAFLRTTSRVTTVINSNAVGLLRGLTGYIIGKGFEPRVTTKDNDEVPAWVLTKAQDVIDEFCERTLWDEFQQELFRESVRDGEWFTRLYFRPDGRTVVRRLWPESIMQPPGSSLEEWSWGIKTDPDDYQTVHAYWTADPKHPHDGEVVPASEVVHYRRNTPGQVKRGMPDFIFDTREVGEMARRLRRNMSVGAALQASIAWVEQYAAASEAVVAGIGSTKADATFPRLSLTGDQDRRSEWREAGEIVRIGKGKEFVPPPGPTAAESHLSILHACYRGICVRWNAPDWLGSADSSNNNYASSLVAESPFVRTGEMEQGSYAARFAQILKRVIWHAARSGLMEGVPEHLVEKILVQVTPPLMAVRDRNSEVNRLAQEIQLGLTSKQTAAQELDRDWENEQTNIRAEGDQGNPQASAMPQGAPGGGGGEEEDPLAALFGEATEAERRTDKRGRPYCYEKGHGRVACGDDDAHEVAHSLHQAGDYHTLREHLQRMTSRELKQYANQIEVKYGKDARKKEGMIEAIMSHRPAQPPTTKTGIQVVPLSTLKTDPHRFQYKLNVQGPHGTTQELKGVRTWRPEFAGVILAWNDPADGRDYVVNGHHRYELAERTGQTNMAVHYIEAPDARTARAVGALANIAEGRGTAVDAAKFMRDTGTGPEDFEAEGVSLKGRVAADAAVLAGLSDNVFRRVVQEELTVPKAVAIGAELTDHDHQDQLIQYIEGQERKGKRISAEVVAEMAKEMAATPSRTETTASLFGDWESSQSLFLERARLKAAVRDALARETNAFKAVSTDEKAELLRRGDNVIRAETNRQLADEAGRNLAMFDREANLMGGVSDAVNDAATQLADNPKAFNSIRDQLIRTIRDQFGGSQ